MTTPDVIKVIVIGDSSVGKTALLVKFVDGIEANTTATIGVDFKNKMIEVEGKPYKLQLWDTAGQERFKTIATSYYRRAHGIALLYDVSNTQSFDHIPNWLTSVRENTDHKVPTILIGNKCDLALKVSVEEGEAMAKENEISFFLTSAKTGENINDAFDHLAKLIIEDLEKQKDKGNTKPAGINIADEKIDEEKKKSCC